MPYRWTLTDLVAPYVGSEVLTKDPIGWDGAVINMIRSEKYKGMNTLYTNSLKFHCDGGGKDYIDAIYESEGIDGRIDVLIEYDCDGSGTYDTLFNGIINLASYKTDGEYTICNIEESDLHTKLAMRDDISVDLEATISIGGSPITAPAAANMPTPSMVINYYDIWRINNGYTYNYIFNVGVVPPFSKRTVLSMVLDNADINTANSVTEQTLDVSGVTLDPFSPLVTFNDNGITYPLSVDYSIDWHGTFTDNNSDPSNHRVNSDAFLILQYGPAGGTPTQIVLLSLNYSTDNYSNAFNIVASGTININAGDSIWLNWFVSETGATDVSVTWTFSAESTFSITTDTTYTDTVTKSVLIHEAFNQAADAVADGDGHFYSEFYGRTDSEKVKYSSNGCGSQIAITNGLNLREFANKSIFASFGSLFESLDCLHNIGMGIENNTIRIEPINYFFDGLTKIISLPNVAEYEQKCDNTRFINKIEIGYQKWESEFRGGLDDPNAKHEYSTIISSIKNTYTRLCKYITSPYTIEFTRRKNKAILATEDWRYDNDNFLIAVVNSANAVFAFSGSTIFIQYILPNLAPGHTIIISRTGLNDGAFTVVTSTLVGLGTLITVAEPVANQSNTKAFFSISSGSPISPEVYPDSFSYGAGMNSIATAYNLRLTPARMLLAHMGVITAGLQLIKGLVRFVKGEGNALLECSASVAVYTEGCPEEYKSQQLKENQSFTWNDANVLNIEPIWLPEIYTFEYPLTYSQFKAIKANPYGYIEFYKFSTDVKAGFIINMEYQLKTGLTKFELLRKA